MPSIVDLGFTDFMSGLQNEAVSHVRNARDFAESQRRFQIQQDFAEMERLDGLAREAQQFDLANRKQQMDLEKTIFDRTMDVAGFEEDKRQFEARQAADAGKLQFDREKEETDKAFRERTTAATEAHVRLREAEIEMSKARAAQGLLAGVQQSIAKGQQQFATYQAGLKIAEMFKPAIEAMGPEAWGQMNETIKQMAQSGATIATIRETIEAAVKARQKGEDPANAVREVVIDARAKDIDRKLEAFDAEITAAVKANKPVNPLTRLNREVHLEAKYALHASKALMRPAAAPPSVVQADQAMGTSYAARFFDLAQRIDAVIPGALPEAVAELLSMTGWQATPEDVQAIMGGAVDPAAQQQGGTVMDQAAQAWGNAGRGMTDAQNRVDPRLVEQSMGGGGGFVPKQDRNPQGGGGAMYQIQDRTTGQPVKFTEAQLIEWARRNNMTLEEAKKTHGIIR